MTITNSTPETWKDLQNEVAEILKQCGFSVEIEKRIQTARGEVEIDVYAEEQVKGRKYSIICECKHWKSAIPQNVVHAFRTVVGDIGANIGYIISLNGFQIGSFKTSEFTNIELKNWLQFQESFFESWYEEYFSPELAKRTDPILSYSEPFVAKWYHDMSDEDQLAYNELKNKYDMFGWIVMGFTPYARTFNKSIPSLPLTKEIPTSKEVSDRIPNEILTASTFKEFMKLVIEFGDKATNEFRALRDKYKTDKSDA